MKFLSVLFYSLVLTLFSCGARNSEYSLGYVPVDNLLPAPDGASSKASFALCSGGSCSSSGGGQSKPVTSPVVTTPPPSTASQSKAQPVAEVPNTYKTQDGSGYWKATASDPNLMQFYRGSGATAEASDWYSNSKPEGNLFQNFTMWKGSTSQESAKSGYNLSYDTQQKSWSGTTLNTAPKTLSYGPPGSDTAQNASDVPSIGRVMIDQKGIYNYDVLSGDKTIQVQNLNGVYQYRNDPKAAYVPFQSYGTPQLPTAGSDPTAMILYTLFQSF